MHKIDDAPAWFKIDKITETGEFSNTSKTRVTYLPLSLISFLVLGRYDLYTDRITLLAGRASLLLGLAKATLMTPIRACEAILRILEWKTEKNKVVCSPTPENAGGVENVYKQLVCHSKL